MLLEKKGGKRKSVSELLTAFALTLATATLLVNQIKELMNTSKEHRRGGRK